MASARSGSILSFFQNALKQYKQDILDQLGANLEEACRSAMQEISEDIIKTWFRGWDYTKTVASTQYQVIALNKGADSLYCKVQQWTDSAIWDSLGEPEAARRYVNLHSKTTVKNGRVYPAYPIFKQPSDWVLHQLFDLGNIGLPPYGVRKGKNGAVNITSGVTKTGWENKRPHNFNPLSSELANSPKWSQYEAKVLSKL